MNSGTHKAGKTILLGFAGAFLLGATGWLAIQLNEKGLLPSFKKEKEKAVVQPHVHPLLNSLDTWKISPFPGTQWAPVALTGGEALREMYASTGKLSFPASAWKTPVSGEGFQEVLFLGCIPVKASFQVRGSVHRDSLASSTPQNRLQIVVDPPLDDQEEWETWFRSVGRSNSTVKAADLVILARGCEAGGLRDKALWLVQKALILISDEEHLARLTQHRFCQWQYELALDTWMENVDWVLFKERLQTLVRNAPDDWIYREAVTQLVAKIPSTDLIAKASDNTQKALLTALYGTGPAASHVPKGNWLLFPQNERTPVVGETQRFANMQDEGSRALPLLRALIADETACGKLSRFEGKSLQTSTRDYTDEEDDDRDAIRHREKDKMEAKETTKPSVTWGKPRQASLRRRPAATSEVVKALLVEASLWKASSSTDLESLITDTQKAEDLLLDKTGPEKFVAILLEAEAGLQDKAAFAMMESGYAGPWETLDNALLEKCKQTGKLTLGMQTLLRLRGKEAESLNQRLRTAQGRWNPPQALLQDLDSYLNQRTLADVFRDWPQDRSALSGTTRANILATVIATNQQRYRVSSSADVVYSSSASSRQPVTTRSRVLATAIEASLRNPGYTGDFLELGQDCIDSLESVSRASWPNPARLLDSCREPLQKLLADKTQIPLISRTLGEGIYLGHPGEIAAWTAFKFITPAPAAKAQQKKTALNYAASSLLGREWLAALTQDCQEALASGKRLDASVLKAYQYEPSPAEVVNGPPALPEILAWSAKEFREKWAAKPLEQRVLLALLEQNTPLPTPLEQLRNTIRITTAHELAAIDAFASPTLPHQTLEWVTGEARQGKGAVASILWHSGLGGVDVETDHFTDANQVPLKLGNSLFYSFSRSTRQEIAIIVSARCHDQMRTWQIDPDNTQGSTFVQDLEEWQLRASDRPLAQTSIWFIAVPKSVAQSILPVIRENQGDNTIDQMLNRAKSDALRLQRLRDMERDRNRERDEERDGARDKDRS